MNDPSTMLITAHFAGRTESCSLPLSASSCWAGLLGRWPLPTTGAIDELDPLLSAQRPERITLRACPSACLLPILWIRSIWFPTDTPELVIEWTHADDPSCDHARQPAGKLACMLADRVRCDDPDGAWRLWGYSPAHAPIPEESFDLLTNIIDLWDTDLQRVTQAADWAESMRRALVNCAALGHRRVGIYGGGTHTRGVGEAFMEPGVEIVCVIDDDSRRLGERMWGFPIVSPERALDLDLDAVVISANSIEDLLWERAALLRGQGIAVIRLYGAAQEDAGCFSPAGAKP